MNTMDKHLALMGALGEKTTLLQTCKRVNIEQKYPPYFRTFVAVQRDMTKDELRAIEDIAEQHTLNANAFRAGTTISAITFTDMDESMNDR